MNDERLLGFSEVEKSSFREAALDIVSATLNRGEPRFEEVVAATMGRIAKEITEDRLRNVKFD